MQDWMRSPHEAQRSLSTHSLPLTLLNQHLTCQDVLLEKVELEICEAC